MSYTDILYDKSDGVATITLNRPQVLNAFRSQTLCDMLEALYDASSDRSVGVIVFRGAGESAFCVGGDIAEMRDLTPQSGRLYCAASLTSCGVSGRRPCRSSRLYAVIASAGAMRSTWPVT